MLRFFEEDGCNIQNTQLKCAHLQEETVLVCLRIVSLSVGRCVKRAWFLVWYYTCVADCFHRVGGACPIVCVGHTSGLKTVYHRTRATSLRGPVTLFFFFFGGGGGGSLLLLLLLEDWWCLVSASSHTTQQLKRVFEDSVPCRALWKKAESEFTVRDYLALFCSCFVCLCVCWFVFNCCAVTKQKQKTKKKFRITAVRGWNDDCYQFCLWKMGYWFETVFSVGFQLGFHTKQLLQWTLWKRFVSSRYARETTVPVKVPRMGCSKTVQCLNCKTAFAVWTISSQETGSRVNFRYHRLRQRGSSVRCLFYIVCVTTAATAATLALRRRVSERLEVMITVLFRAGGERDNRLHLRTVNCVPLCVACAKTTWTESRLFSALLSLGVLTQLQGLITVCYHCVLVHCRERPLLCFIMWLTLTRSQVELSVHCLNTSWNTSSIPHRSILFLPPAYLRNSFFWILSIVVIIIRVGF